MRLGLCCTFLDVPIRFRTTTARYTSSLRPKARRAFLSELALHNAAALADAIRWCAEHGIGAFRITSGMLPLYTHPTLGWQLDREIVDALTAADRVRAETGVRLSFHPDQFVVPGSLTPRTVEASLRELEYMGEIAELVGAEQLTIHGGGAQGGKPAALARLAAGLARLSLRARSRVVLENDDRVYTVRDLLPICDGLALPLVYDVHHHRCNPDGLTIEEATELAIATWRGREAWMHLSSPARGWRGTDPRPHADYIAAKDVPACWLDRAITIDIEAKAKEKAVLRLQRQLVSDRATRANLRRTRPTSSGHS